MWSSIRDALIFVWTVVYLSKIAINITFVLDITMSDTYSLATSINSQQANVSTTPRLRYTLPRLFNIRRYAPPTPRPHTAVLAELASLGILHYRGCRAGRSKRRRIQIQIQLSSNRAPTDRNHVTRPRVSCLIDVPRVNTVNAPRPYTDRLLPKLYVLNAASLAKPHAIEQLSTELSSLDIDIALITETHLKGHHSEGSFSIQGYTCVRRDRVGRRGGGVAAYVRNDVKYSKLTVREECNEYETLWLSLDWNNKTVICVIVYHPPKPIYDVSIFKDYLFNNIEEIAFSHPSATILAAGDFNQLQDIEFCAKGLISLVQEPTRGANCLDRIYTTAPLNYNIKVVKSLVKTDHSAVVFSDSRDIVINSVKLTKTVNYRPKSPALHSRFLSQVKEDCFETVLGCDSVQECADHFYAILLQLFDKYYPLRHCTITNCDPPFITPEIKSLLRKKNELMRSNKIEQASAIGLKVGKLIARRNSSKLAHISAGGSSMWDEVRKLTANTKHCSLPTSISAQSLNTYYASVSTDPCYLPPASKLSALHPDDPITEFAVFKLLDKLQSTASGPDDLPFWFLRTAAPIITRSLTYLINLSLNSSSVPTQWKAAVIHPIPKISSPLEPSHMRPISVVSILSRLTERLVITSFYTPALLNFPTLSNQFAYRPTCSTTAALISLFSQITRLLETNTFVFVLTFDYSKAFDTLSHDSVGKALANLSIPDHSYNWTLDYLTNRTHHTTLNGAVSSTASISAGVIQGSVLGPTLFNIASASLAPLSDLNTYLRYADDGYLVVPGSNANSIPQELHHHAQWAAQHNLKLNLSKTSEIVFSSKRCRTSPPPPTQGIVRVNSLKILGVLVDGKLNFQPHINDAIKSCNQGLFALRTLRQHGLPDESLRLTFTSKILSKLSYASPAWWGFITESSENQLDAFLRKACRLNYYSDTHLTFSTIVEQLETNLFNNIASNPHHCLHSLLPPLKSSNYNLRSRGHSYKLPAKDDRNFINRLLYRLV